MLRSTLLSFASVLVSAAHVGQAISRARVPYAPRLSLSATESPLLERSMVAARACSLAFVPPAAIPSNEYALPTNRDGTTFSCVGAVEDPRTQIGVTVLTTSSGMTVVACRGSSSVKSFQTNLNVGPVPLMTKLGAHPTARVHAGFQSVSKELWSRVQPLIEQAQGGQQQQQQQQQVLFTGHSLGGGTATMLALKFREVYDREAELITVAGPKLGNADFGQHFRDCMPGSPAYHLLHDKDEVITSNAELWSNLGFEHVGTQVMCSSDRPELCDEDTGCDVSERPAGPPSLKGVFVDHCNYLGLYIGLRMEHPEVWLRPFW